MRSIIVAVAILAASPALAQPVDDELVGALPAPGEVRDMARSVDRALGAMLDLPIGGVVQAIDPTRQVRRGETVREMAGEGDPEFEDRLRSELYQASDGVNLMVEQFAVLAPVLRRSLEELERNLGRAIVDAQLGRR